MIEIKQSEFEQYPVFGGPNLIKELYGVQATSERFWFKHDDMLGIVLFDNIDGDWSMIALAKDNVGVYRGFEVACSYRTAAAAKRALRQVLEKPRRSPADGFSRVR